jgi:primosomal protein N'
VQTNHSSHYAIEYAKKNDYISFYNREIEQRRKLNYPPYCDIAKITIKNNIEIDMEVGAQLEVGKSLVVEEGARLNIVNGAAKTVNVVEYVQEEKVDMEVFGVEEGEERGRSDQIISEGRV